MSASIPDRKARRCGVMVLALLLPGGVLAAAAPGSQPPPSRQTRASGEQVELGEVLVSGEQPTRKIGDLIPWLRRLVGQYTYQGYVDLGGKGRAEDRLSVRGVGTCVGFGMAPGVQCEIHVVWPERHGPDGEDIMGGVSTLAPAMILYGLEPDEVGIRYLQVDNKGLAEGATGLVTGDTATFRTPCADIPEGCQRVVRITAGSEGNVIDMQIDTELDHQLAMRVRFQMQRAPLARAGRAR